MCTMTPPFLVFQFSNPFPSYLLTHTLPPPKTHTPSHIHTPSQLFNNTLHTQVCRLQNVKSILYFPRSDRTLGHAYNGLGSVSTKPHLSQANRNMQTDFGVPWLHKLLIHRRAQFNRNLSNSIFFSMQENTSVITCAKDIDSGSGNWEAMLKWSKKFQGQGECQVFSPQLALWGKCRHASPTLQKPAVPCTHSAQMG